MSNTQPYTVMTVCTGNICRSPMGEIILRHFFNERGLGDQVNVESSGVSDEEWSHPIDPRAVRVLRERGYGDEIPRDHFAHRISREEIDRTDLFLPMTASHMRALLRMLPAGKRAEVHMYRSFDPNLPKPKPGREDQIDLVDPWYGGKHEFEVASSEPVMHTFGERKEICGKAPALKIIWTIGRKTILVRIIRNLILAVFRKISRHRRVICKVPPISVARISSWGILCRNLCCASSSK